jgi:hypothetical protein
MSSLFTDNLSSRTGSLDVTGLSNLQQLHADSIIQQGTEWTSGNTATLDFSAGNGNVAFCEHTLSGNVTFAITNIPTVAAGVFTASCIIDQGTTARIVNTFTMNGTSKTIEWSGGSAPTGNASTVDVFNFVCIDFGGSGTISDYRVLGNMNGGFA